MRWQITPEKEIWIENLVFDEQYCTLFPDFYFLLSGGADQDEILNAFPEYDTVQLKKFIARLRLAHVLTDHIQPPFELFAAQGRLFQPARDLPEDYFMNADHVAAYRRASLERGSAESAGRCIELRGIAADGGAYAKRRSVRCFCESEAISMADFTEFLRVFMQFDDGSEFPRYPYPSAGGLYPIDCYVHIKPERVAGIAAGLYRLDTVKRRLIYVSAGSHITKECHNYVNKEIFTSSAFSLHLIYDAGVSMPKYGAKAYYYAMLDAGIMTGYLYQKTAEMQLGCCSIGDLKFDRMEEDFCLTENQVWLHTIEVGIPV